MLESLKRLDDRLESWIFDGLLATRGRAAAVVLAFAGLAWIGWGAACGPVSCEAPDVAVVEATEEAIADQLPKWLADRPWLDDMPINPTPDNPCHAYFFLKEDRQGLYVTFKSRYRQEIELFYYRMRGKDQIEIYLPETKKKAVGSIEVREASKGQFDLQLKLSNDPKGKGEYYSFKSWDQGTEGLAKLPEQLAESLER
jgi:hypothetical protein